MAAPLASATAGRCRMRFFSSRRRHTRSLCDWSSDVCSSDLRLALLIPVAVALLWPLFLWVHFHDPLIFVRVRKLWGWHGSLSVPYALTRWRESRMLIVYPFLALIPDRKSVV